MDSTSLICSISNRQEKRAYPNERFQMRSNDRFRSFYNFLAKALAERLICVVMSDCRIFSVLGLKDPFAEERHICATECIAYSSVIHALRCTQSFMLLGTGFFLALSRCAFPDKRSGDCEAS